MHKGSHETLLKDQQRTTMAKPEQLSQHITISCMVLRRTVVRTVEYDGQLKVVGREGRSNE